MAKSLWERVAAKCAEDLVRDLGIDALPVDPFAIAEANDIEVRALPPEKEPGISGMLLRSGNYFGILYAMHVENEGFRRFCIAHELGHYHLPGHPESVLTDGAHTSYAGFVSRNRYELEADHFAASLLMPSFLFDPALDKAGSGLDAIQILAEQSVASLTATAICYAQRCNEATAIIMSTGRAVDYCFISEPFRDIPDLRWLRKGTPVPQGTATFNFNSEPQNVIAAKRSEAEAQLKAWFDCGLDIVMLEEVMGLGRYGKTLTVLTVDEVPDAEELEEEEELIESWTPRFRR